MTLSRRLALAMVLLVVVTTGVLSAFTYYFVAGAALPRALDRLATKAALGASKLEATIDSARQDAMMMQAGVALEQMAAARSAEAPPQAELPIRQIITPRFLAMLKAKSDYEQLRIAGIADGGRELVRVDRGGSDDAVRAVPAGELRRVGAEDYFRRTIAAAKNAIYVSGIEHRQAGPGRPGGSVLHVGGALGAPGGAPFGAAVIDINLAPKFERIRDEIAAENTVVIVDAAGNYLLDSGFGGAAAARIQSDFPGYDAALAAANSGSAVWKSRAGERYGVGWQTVQGTGGPGITVLVAAPYALVHEGLPAAGRAALIGGALAVLLAIALAVAMARSLSRPLQQMTQAVEAFSRGEAVTMPFNSGREIAVLASAFAGMSTQQKRAYQDLVDSEQMAQAIINTTLDAFVQTDGTCRILDWSPNAEALTGWSRSEAVDRQAENLVFQEWQRVSHRQWVDGFLAGAAGGRAAGRYEAPLRRKDGSEFLAEVSLTALRRGDGYIINAFIRDITDKRAAEEQLIQAQKMESVGQLTGGIAHDFNNMLTVITGTIEILADAVKDNPPLAAITKMIDEAADRASQLTANLLAFARKQPLRPQEINVNALVEEVVQLLSPTLGRQIEIQVALGDQVWWALVDPSQLSSALVNLAINARDAMPGGGNLTFSTRNVRLDGRDATAAGIDEGDYVAIEVIDTGTGIPAAIRDKIFDPFFSTKQLGTGTGLGLSMVFGFAKQSGGTVQVDGEEGEGACFRIYLPKADSKPSHVATPVEDGELRGGSETILCVEDDPVVRTHVTARLESLGYRVIPAPNADEALALIRQGTSFDLLFTDIVMPGSMNGRQLAEKARGLRSPLRVLYTSGNTFGAFGPDEQLAYGVLLLSKPYRKAELARMVRLALDRGLDHMGDPIPTPYSVQGDVERFLKENPP